MEVDYNVFWMSELKFGKVKVSCRVDVNKSVKPNVNISSPPAYSSLSDSNGSTFFCSVIFGSSKNDPLRLLDRIVSVPLLP